MCTCECLYVHTRMSIFPCINGEELQQTNKQASLLTNVHPNVARLLTIRGTSSYSSIRQKTQNNLAKHTNSQVLLWRHTTIV